jgi:hypothetical protein
VILDRKLPDGSGDDLLETVTEQFDAITLMITGVSPTPEIIELPIHDYVIKPVDAETFIKKVSLLEKLKVANSLADYSNARKASLLEYHLDNPTEHPLFRRFASRWSHDRLEIAHVGDEALVYELYVGGDERTDDEPDVSVSITGTLGRPLEALLDDEKVDPAGELVKSGNGYAWVDADAQQLPDESADTIGIYRFACDAPEAFFTDQVTQCDSLSNRELRELLEAEYN